MAASDVGPLDWRVSIVDKEGRPSPEFQRRWNQNRANSALIGTISFGSGAPSGTPEDGAEYADTATTPYTLYIGHGGTWHLAGTIAANPTAIAKDTAVNGTASTFMRSDAAPAVQLSTASDFGLVKPDGITTTVSAGVVTAVGGQHVTLGWSTPTAPVVSARIALFITDFSFSMPINMAGTQAYCSPNPSGTTTFSIRKNGSQVGTIAFSTSGSPTLTMASSTIWAIGDRLEINSPASLNGITALAITFKGTRL